MSTEIQYMPVLRWKMAEKEALANLFPESKRLVAPLIEPIYTSTMQKKGRSLERFVSEFIDEYEEYWSGGIAFIDCQHILVLAPNGEFFQRLRSFHRKGLIPVVGTDSSNATQNAAAKIGHESGSIALRIAANELGRPDTEKKIEELLRIGEFVADDVHLIVDSGVICDVEVSLSAVLRLIPEIERWNSLTWIGGAFPKDLTDIEVGVHLQSRSDWKCWRAYKSLSPRRLPNFGDYTIQHGRYQPPLTRVNVSASVRYAAEGYWVIMRGEGLLNDDGPGHAQYSAHAMLLMERPEFCGEEFSYGDNYICERAREHEKTGNPMTWLRAGINHHMTLVTRQLEALGVPAIGV